MSLVEPNEAVVVQPLNCVRLFGIPWTAACQASLSFIISQSLLKLMSIELAMPSNHLILCQPLLLLPSILPSIRIFSNESAFHIRWPEYWSLSLSFSISPSNEYSELISFRMDCLISLWILVPWPGVEPVPSTSEAQGLNRWTVRKVPRYSSCRTGINIWHD